MHFALEIPEILLNILDHCYLPDTRKDTSSLVTLARTCRAFKDPALDVLWKSLGSLSPLLLCLPEVSHRLPREKVYSLSRPLTGTEWDTLRSYTRRIRYIVDFETSVDEQSLRAISNPPTTESLFPNLIHLSCRYNTAAIPLSYLPLPSLTTLDLKFSNEFLCLNYLRSFPKFTPNLKRLYMYVRGSERPVRGIDPSYFHQWQDLEYAHCFHITLDTDSLVHLSRMPALAQFSFTLSTTLPSSPLSFPTLYFMGVRSGSLDQVPRFLSQTRLPIITQLTVLVGDCPSKQDVSSLVAEFRTSSTPDIVQGLGITHLWTFGVRHHPNPPLLVLDDLWPFTQFNNLRSLHFNADWNIGLTENDLLVLGSACPRVEEFSINPDWGWNGSGGITPDGLVQFFQICRSLSKVALAIDTRGYTNFSQAPESAKLTLPPTFSFDVVDSRIEEESMRAMADFFTSIAPCANFPFRAWDSLKMLNSPDVDLYIHLWRDAYALANHAISRRS